MTDLTLATPQDGTNRRREPGRVHGEETLPEETFEELKHRDKILLRALGLGDIALQLGLVEDASVNLFLCVNLEYGRKSYGSEPRRLKDNNLLRVEEV